jgi:hypothetical protein
MLIVVIRDMAIHHLQEDSNRDLDLHSGHSSHSKQLHQGLHLIVTVKLQLFLQLVLKYLQLQLALNHIHQHKHLLTVVLLQINHQRKACQRLCLKTIPQQAHQQAKITIDLIRFVCFLLA